MCIRDRTLTDNKNRTASKIREIFQKNGGNLGTQGSASHNFKQLGIIRVNSEEMDAETMLEIAVNSGADECFSNKSYHEIHCNKEDIYDVKKIMEKSDVKLKKFVVGYKDITTRIHKWINTDFWKIFNDNSMIIY